MKVRAWMLLLALAVIWGAYVIGKQFGHFEAAAATKERWKAQSEAVSPASAPPKGQGWP